uniref:Uncharacterized protein n=1 Tax=Proboscia inermis TaxID=420281 RepID=A0A7S0CEU5_9STRA|mmetsp:Transcript_44060/g.44563  ORF Transcript_44060/g.44563 Transcript_44060/m.44563 type:complete len:111 (+) Transcript_44060:195-527(+)
MFQEEEEEELCYSHQSLVEGHTPLMMVLLWLALDFWKSTGCHTEDVSLPFRVLTELLLYADDSRRNGGRVLTRTKQYSSVELAASVADFLPEVVWKLELFVPNLGHRHNC